MSDCAFRSMTQPGHDPAGQGAGPSVRLPHEDERRPRHDRRAGADERYVGVLDLARPGTARGLQGALDDVPKTVDAPGAQAAAEGVQRQLAVQLNPSVLDEIERLAFLAEP